MSHLPLPNWHLARHSPWQYCNITMTFYLHIWNIKHLWSKVFVTEGMMLFTWVLLARETWVIVIVQRENQIAFSLQNKKSTWRTWLICGIASFNFSVFTFIQSNEYWLCHQNLAKHIIWCSLFRMKLGVVLFCVLLQVVVVMILKYLHVISF